MKKLLKRWVHDHQAVAALEFALISPVLLLLIAGVVEFGRAFQVYEAVNQLTSQYAIAFADCNDYGDPCSTELATYTNANAVKNIFPQLVYSNLSLQVFQVLMNTSTPYAVSVTYPSGGTLTSAQTTAVQTALTAAAQSALAYENNQPSICGVIVTASYTHSLAYFPTLMTPLLGSYLTPSSTVVQLKTACNKLAL